MTGTSGTTDKPADVADTASPPPCGDRAAVVLRLKVQHTARGAAADKPPPRYYGTLGTAERPETQRNAATFAERKADCPEKVAEYDAAAPRRGHRPAARALVWTGGPPCCRPGPGAAGGTGGVSASGPGGPGRGPDLRCPYRAGGALQVGTVTRAAGFTHVVRYGRTSALGSAETPSLRLLDGASHVPGPAGHWSFRRVRQPGARAGSPFWALRLGAGRDSASSGAAQTT